MTAPADLPPTENAAQIAYWNDRAAVTWVTLQERIDAMMVPITRAALAAAAAAPGERIIDIGCGCGATILELSPRVGPAGHVLGVDVSEPMAGRARERVAAAGIANAEIVAADATTHAFPAEGADLLFSRFGVMFFADPTAAFVYLRHAMKPSGRLLFACWRPLAENSWFTVPLAAGAPLLPPQPPAEPNAPGPFAFADPERVRRILADSGWRDIALAPHDLPMHFAASGDLEAATELATRVGPLARMLNEADPDLRPVVRAAVSEALRPYDGPDGFVFGGAIWLVSARA
jgi:SAM-dependent methyltransferase